VPPPARPVNPLTTFGVDRSGGRRMWASKAPGGPVPGKNEPGPTRWAAWVGPGSERRPAGGVDHDSEAWEAGQHQVLDEIVEVGAEPDLALLHQLLADGVGEGFRVR